MVKERMIFVSLRIILKKKAKTPFKSSTEHLKGQGMMNRVVVLGGWAKRLTREEAFTVHQQDTNTAGFAHLYFVRVLFFVVDEFNIKKTKVNAT